ncbi:uncharacterized protein LOC129972876 [Argiope bruennichi]|uniref:uncharacterized protein LOC129972876 n=1 Tax=Argiope bruennichi TaxID=94029 RepID=UPI002494E002|nr:uncharacterized protein LOC129972876 [Argiope bruennichi]
MFVLLFLISLSSDTCHSQYVYGGIVPYDPRYAVRRPVRRSAIEALERLRLPVARYFPQVDTQVASAPFPWRPSDMYALPAQWSDEYVPTVEEDETTDYGNYDYENAYRPQPVYAEEVYPQEVEPEMPEGGPLYNDLMSSYLMEVPERPEMFENVQRRSGVAEPVHLDRVLEANEKASGTTAVSTTSAPSPSTTTQASQQQVQVTAVPASPEKKNVKSLVVPDVMPEAVPDSESSWRDLGQKEEPLFRPLQNSQRTVWSEMDLSPLSRAKNTQNKSPIPLLKQMIQSGVKNSEGARDPLLEELTNLKKKPGV